MFVCVALHRRGYEWAETNGAAVEVTRQEGLPLPADAR